FKTKINQSEEATMFGTYRVKRNVSSSSSIRSILLKASNDVLPTRLRLIFFFNSDCLRFQSIAQPLRSVLSFSLLSIRFAPNVIFILASLSFRCDFSPLIRTHLWPFVFTISTTNLPEEKVEESIQQRRRGLFLTRLLKFYCEFDIDVRKQLQC
ncbi:hypothetical protein RYX36_013816, partial [Vicia faba]